MSTLFEVTKQDLAILIKREIKSKEKSLREIIVTIYSPEAAFDFSKKTGLIVTQKTKKIKYPSLSLIEVEPVLLKDHRKPAKSGNELWRKYWRNMPHFDNEKKDPFLKFIVTFESDKDAEDFGDKVNQKISYKTKNINHPASPRLDLTKIGWYGDWEEKHMPKYPLYIVSKGRYDMRLTADSLENMKVPYYIVVEEHEYELYKAKINPEYGTAIILDPNYKKTYDTFDDLGLTRSTGPGPARNFAWDHSASLGFDRHWVLDDNIRGFFRLHNNMRLGVWNGAGFRACEDFTDRFTNTPVTGLQYRGFAPANEKKPAFSFNTRIYSCLLIENTCKHKWRGRYNEDTDLSLRVLKDGDCTIEFFFYLQGKIGTQLIKGGNTDEFYAVEDTEDAIFKGTSNKSEMLFRMHPDVTKNVWRYGRWHHFVDYLPFKDNRLKYKEGLKIPEGINEYGLKLIKEDYYWK